MKIVFWVAGYGKYKYFSFKFYIWQTKISPNNNEHFQYYYYFPQYISFPNVFQKIVKNSISVAHIVKNTTLNINDWICVLGKFVLCFYFKIKWPNCN